MLQQANGLRLDQSYDHVAQYSTDRVEPFVCSTDITEASVVKQDFLHDEDGHSL